MSANPALWLTLLVLGILVVGCSNDNPLAGKESSPAAVASGKVKLLVKEDGMFLVTPGMLAEAGIELDDLNLETIRLSKNGQAVPALIAENGLVFYGQRVESRYIDVQPYILEVGEPGIAMAAKSANAGSVPVIGDVSQSLHLEENLVYAAEARQSEEDDVWFWYELRQRDALSTEIELPEVTDSPASLQINAWGFTHNAEIEGDHDFDLLINDQLVGTVQWDGPVYNSSTIEIPAGILKKGGNEITLDNRPEGAAFLDIMQINWLELDYLAPAKAVHDRLTFEANEGVVAIDDFSEKPLIFDISDGDNPQQLRDWHFEAGQARIATMEGMTIAAVGPEGFLTAGIESFRESDWRDPEQQADMIIVTTDELAPGLTPLVEAREQQGISVAVLPLDEIYDEFGYGAATPESIQKFVAYAYENWQEPQPRYLFLVGDATTDFLGNLGDGPANQVPSLLVPVQFSGETVSDSRLADVNGDQKPDLAVGRWPVSTIAEVNSLVERTLAYEQGQANDRALFAADGSESRFSDIANYLSQSGELAAENVQILEGPPASEIIAEWKKGAWLTTYVGHGSIGRWGKDDVFNVDEVDGLDAETPPIVLQFTCLTGLFSHPSETSLSEAMLKEENGPVLIVAATSLTLSSHQEPFAIELIRRMQDPGIGRIGDAFQAAKLSLEIERADGLREISDTFALFGDPSTLIVRPQMATSLTAEEPRDS